MREYEVKTKKTLYAPSGIFRTISTLSSLIVGKPIKLTQNIKVYTNQYWLPGIWRRKHNRELREVGYNRGDWRQ